MSAVEHEAEDAGLSLRFDAASIEPVFQPIFDLRDMTVVGYEALARWRGSPAASPEALFAAARAQGRVGELDRACREAALAGALEGGLGAPFSLFVNADARALEDDLPGTPRAGFTLVMEVTERALTERPEPLLRALTELRRRGWGVALDDVGADSRSLALMPVLYPDVIKLDLRLLGDRTPEDVARIVTAVGAEAEQRLATVLAEGIDSEAQLATAHAAGATLGQGYLLGEPAPLPAELPAPGRGLRLTSSGGVPDNAVPYQRVTNWRRPAAASLELAEHADEADRRGGGERDPGRSDPAGRPAARHLDGGRPRAGLRRVLRGLPAGGRQLALRDLLRPRDGGRVRRRADGADAVAHRGGRLASPARASAA